MSLVPKNEFVYNDPKTPAHVRSVLHTVNKKTDSTAADLDALEAVAVTATTAFGTTGVLLMSDGVLRQAIHTSIAAANVVTAASAFATDNRVISSDGTGKGVKVTTIPTADVVTAGSNFGAADQLVVSSGTAKGVQSVAILSANLVTAAAAFGTDNAILRADGTGRGAQTSGVIVDDSASARFGSGTNFVMLAGANAGSGATWGGVSNIAIGTNAAQSAIADRNNIFLGTNSGNAAVGNHEGCVFAGWGSAAGGTFADYCIALGVDAGNSASIGAQSTFIGISAGQSITGTTNNVCIGSHAGRSATIGSSCFFLGLNAGRSVLGSGSGNICVGDDVANGATLGNSNFVMGPSAGIAANIGSSNVFVGNNALANGTAASFNVIAGAGAVGAGTTIGQLNVIVGADAGRSLNNASSNENTFVGYNAGNNASQAANVSNSTAIGARTYTTASNQMMFGNTSITQSLLRGTVDVCRSTNACRLNVYNTAAADPPGTSFELAAIRWDSNVAKIGTHAGSGGGTARDLAFETNATVRTQISAAGVVASGSCYQPGVLIETYGAGTAYTLTTTPAAVDFGTTDPVAVLTEAGVYRVRGWVRVESNNAIVDAGGTTLSLTLRRTNNTAADLTNGTATFKTFYGAGNDETVCIIEWEASLYTTTNTNDSLTIFGSFTPALLSGTLEVQAAFIKAERIR